ncbi:M16 family metallopeptidase [Rubritalea tangerina]|uniref:M16 family metallopeptidase n=1 Tax=Rubritalea tangerina TaxID=430798 RepID=A0ABW4ZBM7_9BACT
MAPAPKYHHDHVRGFHIATCEMPYLESVSVGIYIPVGSRHEEAAINGSAHFAEHMIFKGTDKRNALDLAIAIEGAGGTVNAFTTEDQTCLETRGPSELLPHLLGVMSDMLWHSTFPFEEVEREREVIAEEIVMYQENPSDHLHDLLSLALWPDHPLGRSITGSEASILGINADSLKKFTDQHYRSAGISVVVAGNVQHSTVMELVLQHLPKESLPKSPFQAFSPIPFSGSVPLLHDKRDIEQSHLALAFHTTGRHSDNRQTLRMLSLLLGETMSSRLFQELREKRGLCYHIASDFSLYEDTGTLEIHAGLDSDRLEESTHALHKVLTDILHHGFTQDELNQAKSYALGQARIGLETTHAQMSWMGDSLTSFGKIIDPVEARNSLNSVTLDQVHTLATHTFKTENLAIASIGPHRERDVRALLEPFSQL